MRRAVFMPNRRRVSPGSSKLAVARVDFID